MMRAMVKPERCLACENCEVARTCAFGAVIREEGDAKPWIDFLKCSGCGKCKPVCRGQAMEYVVQPCTGRRRMSW
jgi:MinD superfamily P-loop ATPase